MTVMAPFYGLAVGGGEWMPDALSPVGWWDPSDLSTLFQDAAGTTPVTQDGDPVGLMLDKSGAGNHASQPTAGDRPTFRESGGLRRIEHGGTGQHFDLPNHVGVSGADNRALYFAGSADAASGSNIGVYFNLGPGNTGERWSLVVNGSNNLRIAIQGGAYNSSVGIASTGVYGVELAGSTLGDNTIYGLLSSEAASGSETIDTRTGTNKIGAFHDGTLTAAMDWYGMVLVPRVLTGDERAKLQAYLAGKAGL
ncbi:hypothetical protein HW532_12730 [Kaustia mangrovi]|uniref:Uncharacterized protein n=1 Tax=Kaustia mangrovi TaxID=2593653 RepID=A0A7S8HCP6_9HYPH|nr:hypothetical protein [Kaustia mangrovi]QPC43483.1 hypothetical protein HW532_12730 [Kaustia mangrovi]